MPFRREMPGEFHEMPEAIAPQSGARGGLKHQERVMSRSEVRANPRTGDEGIWDPSAIPADRSAPGPVSRLLGPARQAVGRTQRISFTSVELGGACVGVGSTEESASLFARVVVVAPTRETRLAVRRLGVSLRNAQKVPATRTGPRAPCVLKAGRGNLTAFERVKKFHGMRVAQWLMTRPGFFRHNLPAAGW
jgi:hypothetical protein